MKNIRYRFFLAILLIALLCPYTTNDIWAFEKYSSNTSQTESKKTIIMSIGSAQMIANNDVVKIDTAPVIHDGRTYVPLRALSNIFDADCQYNSDTKEITITKGDTAIAMTVDKDTFTVNGEAKTMDAPAFLNKDGRTMVPVRFISNAFGAVIKLTYNENGSVADLMLQL